MPKTLGASLPGPGNTQKAVVPEADTVRGPPTSVPGSKATGVLVHAPTSRVKPSSAPARTKGTGLIRHIDLLMSYLRYAHSSNWIRGSPCEPVAVGDGKLGHPRPGICQDIVSLTSSSYASKISRRDSTRSIKGRMPSSLEMARDLSSRDMAFSRSPTRFRRSRVSA